MAKLTFAAPLCRSMLALPPAALKPVPVRLPLKSRPPDSADAETSSSPGPVIALLLAKTRAVPPIAEGPATLSTAGPTAP